MPAHAPWLQFIWPIIWVGMFLAFSTLRRFFAHRERVKALETARSFADRGQALPAEVVEALKPISRDCSRDLRSGVVLLAVAAAMIVFAAVLSYGDTIHHGLHPLYGVAAFPGLIGVALLAWGLVGRRQSRD